MGDWDADEKHVLVTEIAEEEGATSGKEKKGVYERCKERRLDSFSALCARVLGEDNKLVQF